MVFQLTNSKIILASILVLSFFIQGCASKKDAYIGLSEEQIYSAAENNMKKENFAQAIKDYEALEARYPYGQHSHEAQLGLMSAYHKRHEFALALSSADRFIRMNPRHPKVEYVYYLKGLVNFDQNMTMMYRHLPLDRSARDSSASQAGFDAFKDLIERFPNSEYVGDARQRMVYLRDQLAQHELQVVNYYLKRGAYLSAANRANYIVKNFPETSTIPKALESMSVAYRKLGMDQLALDAEQRLKKY